jgi:uncharacterized glyoxalase superfamily protein PhnB
MTIIAGLRYRDAKKAIDWLCNVFGFEKKAVYEGPDDTIAHAELTFGNAMIFLGSGVNTEFGKLMAAPREIGNRNTHGLYLLTEDADAMHANVKAAGGEILIDIEDKPYGSRDFTCRDPEGFVWSVGTYDPWKS